MSLALGSRLEPLVDTYLIDNLKGDLRHILHSPVQQAKDPGASKVCYTTIMKCPKGFRRYQRAVQPSYEGEQYDGHPGELTEMLESRDGKRWSKPKLRLFDVDGSRNNNVVLKGNSLGSHNFTPFFDENPDAKASQCYKAIGGIHPGGGIYAWSSPDGIKWKKMQADPIITHKGFAFDSQNLAFWSTVEKKYVSYYRTWTADPCKGGLRTISRATSKDLIHWSKAQPMNPNVPGEHLYTSNTQPYFRAPHIYLALPTRFMPARGCSTDILFMSCRAGAKRYERCFKEAFIRPGLDDSRWGNRANYAAWPMVATSDTEISIYVNEYRYTLRTDGFASVSGGASGGEMLTKVFTFKGERLLLNYSTSAAGFIKAELCDARGKALPGYAFRNAEPLVGDHIEAPVTWKIKDDLGSLNNKKVRLRFRIQDADLFSLKFQ